jgi:hypothetical protein
MLAAWLAGAGPLPAEVETQAQLERVRSLVRTSNVSA